MWFAAAAAPRTLGGAFCGTAQTAHGAATGWNHLELLPHSNPGHRLNFQELGNSNCRKAERARVVHIRQAGATSLPTGLHGHYVRRERSSQVSTGNDRQFYEQSCRGSIGDLALQTSQPPAAPR